MFDCTDELHFDCGCDEEFAARPVQRYCGCGNERDQHSALCDDCLDVALASDDEAVYRDDMAVNALSPLQGLLAFAEGTGAIRGEALNGLRGVIAAYVSQVHQQPGRLIRRLLDTSDLVPEFEPRRGSHHSDCRCLDCVV